MTIFDHSDKEKELTEYQDKIDAIMAFADEHSTLGTNFVESVSDQIRSKGFLTEAQKQGIDNIISSFNIDY